MGLVLRGKTYWMRLQHNGKRIQESLNTKNKKLAEKRYAKVLTDLEEGSYFETVKAKRITFKEMAEKYLMKYEKQRDKTSLARLLPVFEDLTLYEITTELVSDYRDQRLKKVKPATVYQELALMRRMFNVARREWKWVRNNPVADLSFSVGNSNARDRWLTVDEESKLVKAASPDWVKAIIVFAINTGMRRSEMLNLKSRDIDFQRRLLTVQESKNKTKRAIPMSDTVYRLLQSNKIRDISGRVFSVEPNAVRLAFERARNKAKIEDIRFHDLRHTFATRLVQSGVDLYKVKELLGHKSISMTMRYAHHCPESLRDSVSCLENWYNSGTIPSEEDTEEIDETLENPLKSISYNLRAHSSTG